MLDVKDLNLEFHDHANPETVVFDFDLHMDEGEIVGLVGESGSGKSMSAMAIAGLLQRKDLIVKGNIVFDGVDISHCERKTLRHIQGNDIAMIFQEPMTALNPVKKVGWLVEESLHIHTNLTDAECKERAINMLKAADLPNPELTYEKYPHELSGGQRQRVMIAAALICNPKLLIADEPTTALDVTVQAQIIDLLARVNKEMGTSILFISHDLSLVKKLCSRVLVMYKGRVVEAGLTEDVFNNPVEEYTKMLIEAIPKMEKIDVSKRRFE